VPGWPGRGICTHLKIVIPNPLTTTWCKLDVTFEVDDAMQKLYYKIIDVIKKFAQRKSAGFVFFNNTLLGDNSVNQRGRGDIEGGIPRNTICGSNRDSGSLGNDFVAIPNGAFDKGDLTGRAVFDFDFGAGFFGEIY